MQAFTLPAVRTITIQSASQVGKSTSAAAGLVGRCKPLVIWVNNPIRDATGLTLERLQEDINRLKEAEAAYQAEGAATYDFTPVRREESQSTNQESELSPQN